MKGSTLWHAPPSAHLQHGGVRVLVYGNDHFGLLRGRGRALSTRCCLGGVTEQQECGRADVSPPLHQQSTEAKGRWQAEQPTLMPAMCWMAPETPTPMYSLGATDLPV